jgi:hypothetical protein
MSFSKGFGAGVLVYTVIIVFAVFVRGLAAVLALITGVCVLAFLALLVPLLIAFLFLKDRRLGDFLKGGLGFVLALVLCIIITIVVGAVLSLYYPAPTS